MKSEVVRVRPGCAGSSTAADHIAGLDLALMQLPADAAGPGTLVRCDSGGARTPS